MATEEQTVIGAAEYLRNGSYIRLGQKLDSVSRYITHLSFKLGKHGSPTGNVTLTIRKVSDDSVLGSKLWGDAADLPQCNFPAYNCLEWKEVTFDSPVFVNEAVRISCEYSGGDSSNLVSWGRVGTDEIATGQYTRYIGSWSDKTGDATYKYTYGSTYATVTTQAITNIVTTTATGNGNVTDLGDSAVTQHGHCWNTTGTPTTADSKTENGVKAAIGAFTSSLTGLTPETLYYVRAYATNANGTSYGGEVNFVAGSPLTGELRGVIAVVETRIHYLDAYGHERGGELPLI